MGKSKENGRTILERYGLLAISLIGLALVALALYLEMPEGATQSWISWFIGGIGTTILTVGVVGYVYELLLRKRFLEDMRTSVEETVNKSVERYKEEIRPVIYQAISKKADMPEKYANISDSGIVDVYKEFFIDKLKPKLFKLENEPIRVLKIWFDAFDKLSDCMVDSINNRGCKVEIILSDHKAVEALKRRVSTIKEYELSNVQEKIKRNEIAIRRIYDKLDDDKKTNLILKYHNDFISSSYIQYGDVILVGLYLHGRLATNGTMLEIKGRDKPFFKELEEHFEMQLENAEPINLEEENEKQ